MVTGNELCCGFRTFAAEVTVPVDVNEPAWDGVALYVTSMVVPPARVGVVQVNVPPRPGGGRTQLPMLVLTLPATSWNDAGRLSSNEAFGAVTLPVLFLICQVNSTLAPTAGPPLFDEPVT